MPRKGKHSKHKGKGKAKTKGKGNNKNKGKKNNKQKKTNSNNQQRPQSQIQAEYEFEDDSVEQCYLNFNMNNPFLMFPTSLGRQVKKFFASHFSHLFVFISFVHQSK